MIALARKGQAVPPPFNIIQPILWGEDYPGGSTFQDKVRRWRAAPNDYEQWVVFASTKMPPNRVPRSIALKDPSLRATIGIYVFSDWTIKDVLGFDTRYTQVRLGANTELGRECFVVVFVFPFSKEAANALQESPDEILAY
jgi:hypothetical protein